MSGTASTNSTPLCLMAAITFEPFSSAPSSDFIAVLTSMRVLPVRRDCCRCARLPTANAKSRSAATVVPPAPAASLRSPRSLRSRDAGLLHNLAEADDLGLHEFLQVSRRGAVDGNPPGGRELVLDLGQLKDRLERAVQLVDDVLRRAGRRDHKLPGYEIKAGDTGFRDRRNIRR